MKSNIIHLSFIAMFVVFSGLINSNLAGQDISKDELDKRAMENFQNKNYVNAVSDFQTLHNLFPKDPRISYYLGRSYLQTNQKLDEACEMLKLAAVKNYGDDSYFYLGRAYQLNYQFDDAEMAYTTFKKTAPNHLLKGFDVDYWLGTNKNAKELSVVAAKINLIKKSHIPANVPESAFRDEINGKYIYVPEELRSKEDIALNYLTLMYVSDNVKPGNYLYFASHSKNSKQGLDIFRVKRLTPNEYSQPEPLSTVINSRYDEEFPYYDAVSGTLYFSSKGHTSSGGYDIFSSRFDSLTKEWKTPERLAFPINTPFDDFLYTLTRDNSGAIFLTNRDQEYNEYMAITYSLQSPAEYISPSCTKEISDLASFPLNEPENLNPVQEKSVVLIDTKNAPETVLQYSNSGQNITARVKEYDKLLMQALSLQAKTDSINSAIKDLQKKTETEKDFQTKQEITANIVTLDKESKRMQKLANEKFNEAEQLHKSNTDPVVQKTSV
jgi:tetratricopeptide (TPR) repeat protein